MPGTGVTSENTEKLPKGLEFSKTIGVPFFLKRGNFSGKHSWKDACFVDASDLEVIIRHMTKIAMDAELCDCAPEYCFVARAMIQTKCAFKAFWGEMPVTKERRYFIRDGNVEFHHPYWPPDSIETKYGDLHTDEPNWKALLAEVNRETPEEVEYLTEQSRKVASALPGYWSVDWLQDIDGKWWLIDMADGRMSFRWEGYEYGGDV